MRAPHSLLALLLFAAACSWAQAPRTHQHSFGNAEQWAHYFDDPARDDWQKPHEVIEALSIPRHARVADIGAGTGYFAMRLAQMYPDARVYAVDIEPDMIRHVAGRARDVKLDNIRPVLATPTNANLPAKVDRVLVVDTYHHIADRETYFRRLRASLRRGAQVAIIDFTSDSPIGPPVADRIESNRVKAEMQRAGYRFVSAPSFLPNQYFLVFAPASSRGQ